MESEKRATGGALTHYDLIQNESLQGFSTTELMTELIERTGCEKLAGSEQEAFLSQVLLEALTRYSDVHLNRHSIRNLANNFRALAQPLIDLGIPIEGATCMELGCGSITPWALSFALLAKGAKRAIAVDIDPVGDPASACRSLVNVARSIFSDPTQIYGDGAASFSPEKFTESIGGFDLKQLSKGMISGLDNDRLDYRIESVYELSLSKDSIDIVFSNSCLEHVPDADKAIEALAGVTKPGGYGLHIIDCNDHWIYGVPGTEPLDFLKIQSTEALVHGCNRLRPKQYLSLFEGHGFEIITADYSQPAPVTEAERSEFVPPWSLMPIDDLRPTVLNILVKMMP
jgi:SAM-dependent methyltransferase